MRKRISVKFLTAVCLTMGLMTALADGSVAARPGMDTDLGDSSASFIGEDINDWYGYSVASAGDVNGDGYDDILVGAPQNGDGGYCAGKTYLFLGKASGWSMDTKPSKADASFRGEESEDLSGSSVAGAGDVNGDGYDDFLIGAHNNDEGGSGSGQTYLILGRASGWSRDTDLSKANASFLGEEPDDKAGFSVAGAGDMNNDGYDDILIGAHRNRAGGVTAHWGQTYLILGRASGWSMDTYLADVNASFWGEIGSSFSGYSVAGAGDVNGDGYDDIIIGAYHAMLNGSGGDSRGQTYLLLGRASGWSMDMNLSNANASFWGEDSFEYSGYSVAGAGDVNSDGYDDILIGAHRNGDGGLKAGQTYLILGRSSGWSMDTNLSKSNASFWGEDALDFSGHSVAGAGDVDGDGYDDILIGAYADEEGGTNAGQTYLILGKATGWSMDTDLSEADASFLGEGDGDEAGFSVAGAGDVNGDGYDDILIGARRDDAGGSDAGQAYLVFFDDGAPPRILKDSTPGVATTGDEFIFNVSVFDNLDINNVTIELWFGDQGYHFNLSTTLSSGDQANGTWLLNITVPSDSLETLHYIVHVRDRAFHLISSVLKDIPVMDNDPPIFIDDLTPSNATTGDVFNFSTNATDNIGLAHVKVEYWYGIDGGARSNLSMELVSGDQWGLAITTPRDSLDALHYRFYADDNATNNATTSIMDVNVTDDDPPTFGQDASPATAETDLSYTFSIPVEDNIGVAEVWVEYWYGDGPRTRKGLNMTVGSVWEHWMVVEATLDDLHYVLWSNDTSGNVNSTRERTVDVIDINGPQLINEGTGRTATTGDPFEFTITVGDNVGLKGATVWYAFGDEELAPEDMEVVSEWPSGNVLYSLIIQVPEDAVGNITYRWEVEDLYGNVLVSNTEYVKVVDDDDPVIVEDRTAEVAHMGSPFTILVTVSDNVGVSLVEVGYTMGDDDPLTVTMAPGTEGVHSHTIAIPAYVAGPLSYRIRVVDLAGNEFNGTPREVPVLDASPPEIIGLTWSDPVKGLDLTVVLDATDNVGVVYASILYRFGDGGRTRLDMDEQLEAVIAVPRRPSGDLHMVLTVGDEAGNQVVGEETIVPLVNAAPVWGQVPVWTLTEEEEGVMDLEPFLSDANDEVGGLTVVCDDDTVTVEGLVLRALYDEAMADWSVAVTVSDGEDDTVTDVVVHIVNVNDAPVIVSLSPANGTRYKEGRTVTFTVEATDEDGDELTITWTSGKRTLGTGATLDHKGLEPGTRVVRVTVSDGEATVEDELTLVVEEDESVWGLWVIVPMMIILVVASLVWVKKVRRRT